MISVLTNNDCNDAVGRELWMAKKPIKKTQSITINDVPTEYLDLFNRLVKWFPRTASSQLHTEPQAHEEMSKGELKTLFFCELIHQQADREFGAGAADRKIKRHINQRDVVGILPTLK